MLVYTIEKLPDLTLSKYQVFEDTGVDGVLDMQTRFIRQIYRASLIGKIHLHFLYYFNPQKLEGKKLEIYLIFSGDSAEEKYYEKIRKIVNSSNISNYFYLKEVDDISKIESHYRYMAIMTKKERILQTVINSEERHFYLVPNWKIRNNARLYSLFKMMQSFNEECCYRVDLYTEKDLEENIHNSFERPLTFLRNVSNRNQGISEFSKLHKEQRDPNADETLKQYEEWLKSVDMSSLYRCRISVLADDEKDCQLLLDSALVECLESGNVEIKIKTGRFQATEQMNEAPDGDDYHSALAPKSMRKWTTTYTVEEAAAFTRFPILYDGESIELSKETAPVLKDTGIVLGTESMGYKVSIMPEMLPKHMFVCGVPGSGKTNTMLHIANSLWNHEVILENGHKEKLKIPFLILEPAKKEYRELALFNIPELVVFSPSACTNFPIRINPFEFAKGLTLSEHISRLCQVFEGAFPIAPPAPFILDRAIQAIYEKHGWNVKEINMGQKEYPLMSELYEQFEKELLTTNYDSEIQGNIRSVLEMRIGSLLRREMKEIFDVPKSTFLPEEWMKYPIIVELEALGEGPANFVTLLLCTLIREVLKVDPYKEKERPVRHVIFIEEAHNLIAPEAKVGAGQDTDPKIAATAFIVKMLAEVRALREGIIIADQLPTAMAPEVIKNTNIKMVHRLTSADDRGLVGSTMSASPLQMENMATYTKGKALFSYEDLLRPFEMQVCKVEEHENGKMTDDAILYQSLINKKSCFFDICKKYEIEKWEKLKNKVEDVYEKERKAIEQIEKFNFKGTQYAQFEKRMESCANILNGLIVMRNACLLENEHISEQFFDRKKKQELAEIIEQIGKRYEYIIKRVIQLY